MSKMKTSSKVILAILGVIIAIFAIYLVYWFITDNGSVDVDQLETTKLEKGDLEKVVFADGQVRSESFTQIYPISAGVVKEIIVSENDRVEKDDLLMKIETAGQLGQVSTQEIKATIAGTVTNIWTSIESQVAPGGNPLIEIVDLDNLIVEGLVSESDVNKVDVDQKVRIDFQAIDVNGEEKEFTGRITFVAQSPFDLNTLNPNYRIKVDPDELSERVKFGMTANMEIIVDEVKSVLYVDNLYILKKDGNNYVIKLVDRQTGEKEEARVDLGFEGENETEITSGASEGDEIVLPAMEDENELQTIFTN
jgi:multidrug efflux pump subunit AcrA (membrane-fusion protein)